VLVHSIALVQKKIMKPVVRASTLKKSTKSETPEKKEKNRRRSHKPKKTTNGTVPDSLPTADLGERKIRESGSGGSIATTSKKRKIKTDKE